MNENSKPGILRKRIVNDMSLKSNKELICRY